MAMRRLRPFASALSRRATHRCASSGTSGGSTSGGSTSGRAAAVGAATVFAFGFAASSMLSSFLHPDGASGARDGSVRAARSVCAYSTQPRINLSVR